MTQARSLLAGTVALAILLLTTGFTGLSPKEARVAAVGKAYFAASGPAICTYLSMQRLAVYGSLIVKSGTVAACKAWMRYDEPRQELVEIHRRLEPAYVAIHGRRADAHFLLAGTHSYELALVLERGRWKIDMDDEQLAGNPGLVGKRFPATEEALRYALLYVGSSSAKPPATGPDPVTVRRAVSLTAAYVRLVRADRRLGRRVLERKLAAYAAEADFDDCLRCAMLLRNAVSALGGTA